MSTRIRLLVEVPGAGVPDDVLRLDDEEAAAWVAAGRAELVPVPREMPVETAVRQAPENMARRTRPPRGR